MFKKFEIKCSSESGTPVLIATNPKMLKTFIVDKKGNYYLSFW